MSSAIKTATAAADAALASFSVAALEYQYHHRASGLKAAQVGPQGLVIRQSIQPVL
jgi:hypothetical protein